MPRRKGDDLDDFIVPDDEVEESEDSDAASSSDDDDAPPRLCEKESSSSEDEAPRRRKAPISRRAVQSSSSESEDDSDDDGGIPAGYLYCALCAKPVVADSFSAKQKKLYNQGEEAYCLLHSQGDHRLYIEQLELTAARNVDGEDECEVETSQQRSKRTFKASIRDEQQGKWYTRPRAEERQAQLVDLDEAEQYRRDRQECGGRRSFGGANASQQRLQEMISRIEEEEASSSDSSLEVLPPKRPPKKPRPSTSKKRRGDDDVKPVKPAARRRTIAESSDDEGPPPVKPAARRRTIAESSDDDDDDAILQSFVASGQKSRRRSAELGITKPKKRRRVIADEDDDVIEIE
ncbi:unnamed protein product [Pelagomonas calceolata]|uniref:Uncharacterized protein n=1 Tax=Pelagomonas calceolata TaxID=35677 RepID=A0A8J2STF8_9STRA|nr:unnamed protein product [Pelagomonas calceolata]|mmetsp:Transcript_12970/g.39812  ORF Transcript_12970/g.39812 Transcript_12970/m.39812 type:complete len:348 (-) Transcript_12970:29-1072(-)